MEEPCGEAWIVLEVLGIMVRACEDGGLLEDSKAEESMISLEAYGNDPSGGIFRSLHPCARLRIPHFGPQPHARASGVQGCWSDHHPHDRHACTHPRTPPGGRRGEAPCGLLKGITNKVLPPKYPRYCPLPADATRTVLTLPMYGWQACTGCWTGSSRS